MPKRASFDPKNLLTPSRVSLESSLLRSRRNQHFLWMQQPVNYQLVIEALVHRHPPRLAQYLFGIVEAFANLERDEPKDLSLERRYKRYKDILRTLNKAKTPKTKHDLRVLHLQRSMLLMGMADFSFPKGRCGMGERKLFVERSADFLADLALQFRCYCGEYETPTKDDWLAPRLCRWIPDWTEASYLGQIELIHAILASLHRTTPAQIEKLLSRRPPSAPF